MASHPVFNPFGAPLPTPRNDTIAELMGKELENALQRIKVGHEPERFAQELKSSKARARYEESQAAKEEAYAPYYQDIIQADIAKAMAESQKAQAQLPIWQQAAEWLQGGQGNYPNAPVAPSAPNAQLRGGPVMEQPEYTQPTQQMPQQQNIGRNMFMEDLIGGLLNMPAMNPITTPEGKIIRPSRFGEPHVLYEGPTPAEIKGAETKAAKAAEHEAKVDAEYDDLLRSTRSLEPTYQTLLPIVNSQDFLLATGPGMKTLAKITNNEKANEIVGTLEKAFGQQVNRASRQFRNLNKAEFVALERIMGDVSDNPYAIKAKVNVGNAYRKFDQQVAEIYSDLREQGVSVKESERIAYEKADFSEIQRLANIDNQIHSLADKHHTSYRKMRDKLEMAAASRGLDVVQILEAM